MVSTEVRERIRETVRIPTLPAAVARIRQVLADPEVGAPELAEEVAKDPPIAAKVIKMANSAIYAPREEIDSIHHAVAVLGMGVIENLVLQAAVIRQFGHLQNIGGFDLEDLWKHSILTGLVAQEILGVSTSRPGISTGAAYTCGLLHDIGKFVLIDSLEVEYVRVLARARREFRPSYLSEREALSFTHAELGAMVAHSWQFPVQIGDAIECHHHPRTRVRHKPHVLVVMLADQIANFVQSGRDPAAQRPDPALFYLLGLAKEEAVEVLDFAVSCLASIEI